MSTPTDQLLRDQEDLVWRLKSDPLFATIAVLEEQKGVTDADIEQALGTLNEQGGKLGACAVVLMPSLFPEAPDAPGPRSRARLTVQVIESPLLNRGEGGTGLPASSIAQRVRQLCHQFGTGLGGVYAFAGEEPVPAEDGKVSKAVAFERPHQDEPEARTSTPLITPDEGAAPQLVTLAAAPGAVIRYTLDGSYPGEANPAAQIYAAPLEITGAATLRAVATATGKLASNVAEARFSAAP